MVRYGEEWTLPLPDEEGIVHHIWRHRPEDFEERSMMPVDTPASSARLLARQIRDDYDDAIAHNDGKNGTAATVPHRCRRTGPGGSRGT